MARFFALIMLSTSAVWANPKGDWFASLYTGEGVELRNDERVFALFSIFNAAGFDQERTTLKQPLPRASYHPVRLQVRSRVLAGDTDVRKAAEAFIDAHPQTLRRYLSYVLSGEQPPFAAAPKEKEFQELKGLEQLLGKAWAAWKLEELMGVVQSDSRKALKAYLSGTDEALQRARSWLKVPESAELVIAVNLLDAHDQVRSAFGDNKTLFIVVGPSDEPNVAGVIREFARAQLDTAVSRHVPKWGAAVAVLKEAQLAGASEQTPMDYVSTLIGLSVALKATNANDAAFEAAAARGYFGIRDIAKLLDEGKPPDALVAEALQKIETRRPAKK